MPKPAGQFAWNWHAAANESGRSVVLAQHDYSEYPIQAYRFRRLRGYRIFPLRLGLITLAV